jgi:hypothetical protein
LESVSRIELRLLVLNKIKNDVFLESESKQTREPYAREFRSKHALKLYLHVPSMTAVGVVVVGADV